MLHRGGGGGGGGGVLEVKTEFYFKMDSFQKGSTRHIFRVVGENNVFFVRIHKHSLV